MAEAYRFNHASDGLNHSIDSGNFTAEPSQGSHRLEGWRDVGNQADSNGQDWMFLAERECQCYKTSANNIITLDAIEGELLSMFFRNPKAAIGPNLPLQSIA